MNLTWCPTLILDIRSYRHTARWLVPSEACCKSAYDSTMYVPNFCPGTPPHLCSGTSSLVIPSLLCSGTPSPLYSCTPLPLCLGAPSSLCSDTSSPLCTGTSSLFTPSLLCSSTSQPLCWDLPVTPILSYLLHLYACVPSPLYSRTPSTLCSYIPVTSMFTYPRHLFTHVYLHLFTHVHLYLFAHVHFHVYLQLFAQVYPLPLCSPAHVTSILSYTVNSLLRYIRVNLFTENLEEKNPYKDCIPQSKHASDRQRCGCRKKCYKFSRQPEENWGSPKSCHNGNQLKL